MKNINMKKVVAGVAALGVSALLAGSVVAANVGADNFSMNITKDTMYNNGVPSVSVVVGSMAQPVDVVWAGNIAAAIGKKAYTTAGTVGGAALQDVTIEVGSSSTSTVTGDGYLEDTLTIGGATVTNTLNKDDYSLLHETDISADSSLAGDSTLRVFDELVVESKTFFETDRDIKDLVLNIPRGDIKYKVDLDSGLKFNYKDSDASPSFRFKVMGVEYTVDEINSDGTTMKLIANKNTITYTPGQEFAADNYTIKVIEILDTGNQNNRYEASLQLLDASGNVVSTAVYKSNSNKIFSNYLTSSVMVDTVYSNSVKVVSGSSTRLELRDTSRIKDFPTIGDEMWKVTLAKDANYVTGITLETDHSDLDFVNKKGLQVGDKVELPNEFGSIEFLGLTDETMSDFKVDNGTISFQDDARRSVDTFVYDYATFSTARNDWTTNEEIAGKRLYIKSLGHATLDYNITVQQDNDTGRYLKSDGTWDTAINYISGNYATNAYIPLTIEAPNTSQKLKYGVYLVNEDANASAGLSANTFSVVNTDKDFTTAIIGLEAGANTYSVGRTTYKWYIDGVDINQTDNAYSTGSNVVGAVPGSPTSKTTPTIQAEKNYFRLVLDDTSIFADTDVFFHVDSYTGDLVNVGSNDFTDAVKAVEYGTLKLSDEGNNTDLEFMYTEYGAELSIEDGYLFGSFPERQRKGKIFIGGGSSSETTLNGGELVLTTPGTVVETEDGMISAKLITSTVTGGEEMTAMTPANWNVNNSRLVYLDNETMTSAGAKIIVGGHLVNALANGITDEYLTEAGQYVVGAVENGNIVVAGFSAADTAEAAKALITVIENMAD